MLLSVQKSACEYEPLLYMKISVWMSHIYSFLSILGSGGSLSSLRRRWLRTASTSLDFDSSQSLLTHADSLASCGSLPACADDKPACRTKLGISVIISLTEHQKE